MSFNVFKSFGNALEVEILLVGLCCLCVECARFGDDWWVWDWFCRAYNCDIVVEHGEISYMLAFCHWVWGFKIVNDNRPLGFFLAWYI